MNFKTKQGLAILDAILANDAWEKHQEHGAFDDLFYKVDVDYVNHMVSTEINGAQWIEKYDEMLQDEVLLEELDIIQSNIEKFYK